MDRLHIREHLIPYYLIMIMEMTRVTRLFPCRVSLVLPSGSSKLEVQQDGLHLLRNLEGAISPIVVIGPYRSGKSFTLNQLLEVPCNAGFGVGHTRDTQTKGACVFIHTGPSHSLHII